MNKFEWYLVGAVALVLALGFCNPSHAMDQQEFCQGITADAARLVILIQEKRITYEQTIASIPPGLPEYQDAQLRSMIDMAFRTTEDPMDFAITMAEFCRRSNQPAKYDDAFIHRPGEHHLSQQTIDAMYRDAWKIYQVQHKTDVIPDREPRIGFTTAKGICQAAKSEQDSGCAIALTGGEKALYPMPDNVDILLDEAADYDTLLGSSIVLHEFIHYFQYYNRGPISFCELAIEREHEAYGLQARWLSVHGGGQYVAIVLSASARQHCKGQP